MHSHGAVRLGGELELLLVKASQMERWLKCQTALGQKEMFILIYPDTWNCNVLAINHSPAVGVTWDTRQESQEGETEAGQRLGAQTPHVALYQGCFHPLCTHTVKRI